MESAILQKSFETLPPTHFIVLRHKFIGPDALRLCWKRFGQQLRDMRKKGTAIEYVMYVEQTTTSDPHIHLLVRSPLLNKEIVRKAWSKACASENVTVYCEPVRDVSRAAKYAPKFWLKRDVRGWRLYQPWVPGKEWAGLRLKETSRRFLSHKEDELKAMVKADWFREKEDWDKYSDWQKPEPVISRPFTPFPEFRHTSYADFETELAAVAAVINKSDELAFLYMPPKRENKNPESEHYLAVDPYTLVPSFDDQIASRKNHSYVSIVSQFLSRQVVYINFSISISPRWRASFRSRAPPKKLGQNFGP